MSSIRDGLIPIFVNSFNNKDEADENRFASISGSVCCWTLCSVYYSLVKEKEIEPIENIPIEKKKEYWRLALLFNKKPNELIEAAKSAYILELITSTF